MADTEACRQCGGAGDVWLDYGKPHQPIYEMTVCWTCGGTGQDHTHEPIYAPPIKKKVDIKEIFAKALAEQEIRRDQWNKKTLEEKQEIINQMKDRTDPRKQTNYLKP